MTLSRLRFGGGLFVLLLISIPLWLSLPGNLRWVGALQNAGHALLFCVLALLVRYLWRWPYGWVLVGGTLAGAGIEGVQYFTGRDCSAGDVALDVIGVFAGLAFFECVATKQLRGLALAAVLLLWVLYPPLRIAWLYVQAARHFPVLCDFEDAEITQLMAFNEGLQLALLPAPTGWQGNPSQVARLTFPDVGWPGLVLVDVPSDWMTFEALQVEVWSPAAAPVSFSVALHGLQNNHNHHEVSRTFQILPGLNVVRLPLAPWRGIRTHGQPLLANVWQVILFSGNAPSARVLYIDNLRLLR